METKKFFVYLFTVLAFLLHGVSRVDTEEVSVMEEDSVTLNTGVQTNQQEKIRWYFNSINIAHIKGDLSIICTDVQCNEGNKGNKVNKVTERFRDRLKLDHQTGSLTIMNITNRHSGEYKLVIIKGSYSEKIFSVSVHVVPADPVKTVSVMVGDSVTLNTGVTETQRYDVIKWRFGHLNSPIAEIKRKIGKSFTSNTDEGFKDRLQLDCWSGSLTIRNTETKHSGDYEVDISISNHTIHRSFTVTVSGELKSALSVMEGQSVTLNSSLTEIQTDDLMQWMFGYNVIAKINKAGDRFSTSDGRLKLDHQTGSLTITDTRTTDSELYELKISSSRRTVLKRFIVTVTVTVTVDPALSTGAKAGISVGVVDVVLAFAAAAVAAGVFYHRHKIFKLKELIDKWRILSVMEGERITLNPDDTKVHKDDKLLWMFRGACIAERKSAADRKSAAERKRAADSVTVHDDVLDGRFKDRLKLDPHTGSLTIKDTRTKDSGLYELLITRSGNISIKRFSVSVFSQTVIKPVSGNKGGSVTLETGVTDIQKVDEILWRFGLNTRIAEIKRGTKKMSPLAHKIFKGRLKLDHQTGSLTIKKIRPTDAGIYMLNKYSRGYVETCLFRVNVLEDNPENVHLISVHMFPDSGL